MAIDNLRVFVTVPRSGSTLFMRVIAGNADVGVTSRNILMGNMKAREDYSDKSRIFIPDYSIYTDPDHAAYHKAGETGKKIVVSKEEYGNDRFTGNEALNECNYDLFPTTQSVLDSRPAFVFRDPVTTFDSWMARGWDDVESFILAYKTHLKTFEFARAVRPETAFYTYEYMVRNDRTQTAVFEKICGDWDIDFSPEMLRFKQKFGTEFMYARSSEEKIYAHSNPKGIFTTVAAHNDIRSDIPTHGLIEERDKDHIISELMPAYLAIHEEVEAIYSQHSLPSLTGQSPYSELGL